MMKPNYLKIGEKTYELCLTAKKAAALEESTGKSVIDLLNRKDEKGNQSIPLLGNVALILAAEITNETVTKDMALDIMDKYFDEGHTVGELLEVITNSLGFLAVASKKTK